jgi:hypothetical protein
MGKLRAQPHPKPYLAPETVELAFRALEIKGMIYFTGEGLYIPSEGGWKLLRELVPAREVVTAWGHPAITAAHRTTLEITRAAQIGHRADCIIGVKADKACRDLSPRLKECLRDGRTVHITITAGDVVDRLTARGSPALKLTHPEGMVIRKSDFIDERTLAILADKAAIDLKRELVYKLRSPHTKVRIEIETG